MEKCKKKKEPSMDEMLAFVIKHISQDNVARLMNMGNMDGIVETYKVLTS